MLQLRNLLLGVLALGFLVSSPSQAGNLKGTFQEIYLGPANVSGAANGGISCPTVTNCSFTRAGIVPDGESNWAIILVTTQDSQTVSVDLKLWQAEACQPDP